MFDKNSESYARHLVDWHRHTFNTCELPAHHNQGLAVEQKTYACSVCFQAKKDQTELKACLDRHKTDDAAALNKDKTDDAAALNKDKTTKFACEFPGCSATYGSKKSLLAHGRAAHKLCFRRRKDPAFSLKCQFCNRVLAKLSSLKSHESKCHACPEIREAARKKKKEAKKAHLLPVLPQDPVLPTQDHVLPNQDPVLPTQDPVLPTQDPVTIPEFAPLENQTLFENLEVSLSQKSHLSINSESGLISSQ